MTISKITPKLAGWITALAAAAIAIAVVLLFTTDLGAGILAQARCAGVWITSDAISYRACVDVEREQILEQRRHTPAD
jgi:hypothetical protein